MLICELGCMVILVALHAKVGILGYAKHLSWLWGILSTILANWCLGLLLFMCVYGIVDHINRKYLIVLKNHVLMFENLWILLLTV